MQERLAQILSERYHILCELAHGRVFLAHDLRHDRRVAIKVLDPELARAIGPERFLREIHITAGLTHPHILPLLDSGSSDGLTWFALGYAEDGTLRDRIRGGQRLPIAEAVRIAGEVADALAFAHRRGIVHRDVKPENILFEDDHALLADFGISRALAGVDSVTLTQAASAMGTPAYMSPEQIDATRDVNGAADQYALACVLFELLAGSPPFPRPDAAAVLKAHLAAPPPSLLELRPETPVALARAVERALSKDPGARFESVAAFHDAVLTGASTQSGDTTTRVRRPTKRKWRALPYATALVGAGIAAWLLWPRPQIESIAVLPLANVSGNSAEEYFADGMTEELILELSKVSALRVISRTSVMSLKGRGLTLKEIGKRLGVGAVLEGTVARADGRVRVNVQLFQVKPERQLWSESYDRPAEQSLALQSEIARAVVEPVRVRMTSAEERRLEPRREVPPEAHEAMLRGRYALARLDSTRYQEAIRHFTAAAHAAPGYAEAWSGLARTYYFGSNVFIAPKFAMANARTAAEQALAIDPDLAEAHATLGIVLANYDWKFVEAERECREAVRLNPNDSESHFALSIVLLETGRTQEAVREADLAFRLDPLSNFRANWIANCDYCNGDFARARSRYEAIAATDPNDVVAQYSLALIDLAEGHPTDAIDRLEPVAPRSELTLAQAILGCAYAHAGRNAEARGILRTLEARSRSRYVPPTDQVLVRYSLGDYDGAMECLARAYEAKDENVLMILFHPVYEPLRRDPRFAAFLGRIRGKAS